MDIEAVLRKHESRLMGLPNVTGVGIGEKDGKQVILVFVEKLVSESELEPDETIPKRLDGFEAHAQLQIKVG